MASAMADSSATQPTVFPPVDTSVPQLTLRAVLTGATIGSALALCNVYAGLKIGWGMNMSIAAVLISFGVWKALQLVGARFWGIQENNINQTGASAAASVSSAGLVSAVPALTMLTGYTFTWAELSLWVICSSALGVLTAVLFRRQMLVRDALPFASGIATAETLREVYSHGKEALTRLLALVYGAIAAAIFKIFAIVLHWKQVGLPGSFSAGGALAAKGATSVTPLNLTLAIDPSLLLVGSGLIVGFRTGFWMLFGAIIAWALIGLDILGSGAALPAIKNGAVVADGPWFKSMVEWLLWPGVAMLVTASLTSLAFSAPAFVRAFRGGKGGAVSEIDPHEIPTKFLWGGLVFLGALVVVVGGVLFGMSPLISLAAVGLTIVLAVVALRVSGETNITPVGGMGKVTQLTFGVIDPGNVSTNLMAANVTGGSASQAADMMHDLKTGALIGTSPRAQVISQLCGVLAGALAGSAIYLALVPDPKAQLITSEWPAPAVAQWKAVAEVMKEGLSKLPPGVMDAILFASLAGILLASAEKLAPAKIKKWLPSPTAIGIAFCVPAWNSISFFIGGCINMLLKRFAPNFHTRLLVVTAAGLIVGESLVGLGDALIQLASGGK
jgi:uncharacterized oligopeptide transporter (OPT) family protein